MLNGSVAGLIGLYLLTVLYSDNEDKLLAAIKQETGFLKWGGALLMLLFLYQFAGGKGGELIRQLTMLALIALFLNKGVPAFEQISTVFSDDKETKRKPATNADAILNNIFK